VRNQARKLQCFAEGTSRIACLVVMAAVLPAGAVASNSARIQQSQTRDNTRLEESLKTEVRHQLVLLPYLTVFDNLEYSVDGTTVTLQGQVVRPTLKSDAENVVKRVEGVEKVVNNIEVLPASPDDDQIRRAEYRAIYGFGPLEKYAMSTMASIHIIVKEGRVTLEGVVDNQSDKDAANVRANGVANVFGVTNNLKVVKQ
jgi:hyperosmotically inducible protein